MSSQNTLGYTQDLSITVTGATRIVGVFGHPVEHTRSPAMHNAAFAELGLPYIYVPFSVTPENLPGAIRALQGLGIVGVNLTIPHKQAVLPFLDEISAEANEVGAVNTVHCNGGRLVGDNTDGYGFSEPLKLAGFDIRGASVLVFGAGGAARSVVFSLSRGGASVTIANRSPTRAASLAQSVVRAGYAAVGTVSFDAPFALQQATENSNLIVNTTSLGMYPDIGASPTVPFELLTPSHFVYDLVYNPLDTVLLQRARARGCTVLNGVKMLVYQGAAAFQRWTGVAPPVDTMERAVLRGLQ